MFFKVAFSLLGMLVDPSMIADKEKGAGKLISNIFITLVLIVMVPFIFDYAFKAQSIIMEKKLIEKAVFAEDFSENDQLTLGHRISLSVWGLFMNKTTENGKGAKAYIEIFEKKNIEYPYINLFASINATTNDVGFLERLLKLSYGTVLTMTGVLAPVGLQWQAEALGLFNGTNRYQVVYVALVSTAAGFYLLWSFVKMCIDVSYRAIKLYALRMLSPIAIVSYIDPKSGKNGVFSKWLAECVKTYISLFVRIFVFAIASVILNQIDITNAGETFIERLFFTLAVVAFLKTAPKFIDGILGTELSKDSESKFGADLLKQGLGGLGMAAVGGAVGLATATKRGYNGGRGFWEGAKSGFTGGIEAVNKKDPIGVISGLAKAGNGSNAWRKYYGLPTAAEDRKHKTEADLAKDSAKKFGAKKAEIQKKKFDKMEADDFNTYLNGPKAILDAEEVGMKAKWDQAVRDNDEVAKDRIKREFTNKRFRTGYKEKGDNGQILEFGSSTRDASGNILNPIAAKAETDLEKIDSSDRAAKYRASVGNSAAISETFDKDSEIGKWWLEEEKWSRSKTFNEDQQQIWSRAARVAGTRSAARLGDKLYCDEYGRYYEERDDLFADKGVTVGADPTTGAETFTYNGGVYTSEFDVLKEIGYKQLRESELIANSDVAGNRAGYAASKIDEAQKARKDHMKNPQNAADARDARKAQLIEAGKERGE
jgi:hypothetical protein